MKNPAAVSEYYQMDREHAFLQAKDQLQYLILERAQIFY